MCTSWAAEKKQFIYVYIHEILSQWSSCLRWNSEVFSAWRLCHVPIHVIWIRGRHIAHFPIRVCKLLLKVNYRVKDNYSEPFRVIHNSYPTRCKYGNQKEHLYDFYHSDIFENTLLFQLPIKTCTYWLCIYSYITEAGRLYYSDNRSNILNVLTTCVFTAKEVKLNNIQNWLVLIWFFSKYNLRTSSIFKSTVSTHLTIT